MAVTIYHNPRCSKSRQALELLHARSLQPEVINYLQTPPSPATIEQLAKQLGLASVRELIRTGEEEYLTAEARIAAMDEGAVARWLATHPRALQRPIVVTSKGARIGRPPEAVVEVL